MKKRILWIGGAAALAIVVLALVFRPAPTGQGRFFADQTYHFQTLRVLSDEPFDGADTSEVLETIKRVRSGDEQSWYQAWAATGARVEALAEQTKDPISKGRAYLRAHTYFRTAEFLLPPQDPKRPATAQRNIGDFYKGLDTLRVPYERLRAPYGGKWLPINFYPSTAKVRKNTLLVFHGGYDSTLEELYFVLAKDATEHGYDVLTFDGPGQGQVLREEGVPFTPEWEKPTSAVLDAFLEVHQKPVKTVLIGMSMGGYLAPRAAAFDHRFDGVVAYDVFYDMGASAKRYIPGFLYWLRDVGLGGLANAVVAAKGSMDPGTRWAIGNGQWTLGKATPLEVVDEFQKYTLKGVAQNITADVLILAGAQDHFVDVGQVKDMEQALTSARSVQTVVYDRESGGAEHCQLGAHTLWHATLFDWLAQKFD